MLIEKFLRARIGRHVFEHEAILLEHRPVQALEPCAVHELPYVAHPARTLAIAPEEHAAVVFVDRRDETENAEVAARSSIGAIRNRQAQPRRTGLAEFHPVEVHVALRGLLERQPGCRLLHLHRGRLVARGHRVRQRMQIGAMHRVHDVIDRVTVIALPFGEAQDRAVLVFTPQLIGQFQLAGFLMQRIAEVDEDAAAHFLHRIALDALLAFERTGIDRGHRAHRAGTVDLDAVIPACEPIAEVPAQRQPGAAMRTAIFDRVDRAGVIAPQHQVFRQARNAHRRARHRPARQHRIPLVEQSAVHQSLDSLRVGHDRRSLSMDAVGGGWRRVRGGSEARGSTAF